MGAAGSRGCRTEAWWVSRRLPCWAVAEGRLQSRTFSWCILTARRLTHCSSGPNKSTWVQTSSSSISSLPSGTSGALLFPAPAPAAALPNSAESHPGCVCKEPAFMKRHPDAPVALACQACHGILVMCPFGTKNEQTHGTFQKMPPHGAHLSEEALGVQYKRHEGSLLGMLSVGRWRPQHASMML